MTAHHDLRRELLNATLRRHLARMVNDYERATFTGTSEEALIRANGYALAALADRERGRAVSAEDMEYEAIEWRQVAARRAEVGV